MCSDIKLCGCLMLHFETVFLFAIIDHTIPVSNNGDVGGRIPNIHLSYLNSKLTLS